MTATSHPHLDDSDLIRILDTEPEPASEHVKRHVSECAECAERLRLIEMRSSMLASLLQGSRPAFPAPPSDLWDRIARQAAHEPAGRTGSRWWTTGLARAAFLAGLLITGALVAEPTRQWIAERLAPSGPAVDATGPDVDPPARLATQAGFVPTSTAIVIDIDNRQRDGTVILRFEERSDVMGEVITDDLDAELLVIPPDGFRVRNEPGDTWSYRFRVPLGIRVELRAAGATVAIIEPAAAREVEIRMQE